MACTVLKSLVQVRGGKNQDSFCLARIVVWMLRASIHHNVLTPTGSAQGGDQGPTEGVVGSVHKYLASSLSTNK